MKTTEYYVGTAQRRADGSIFCYTRGNTVYASEDAVRRYIRGLHQSYKSRKVPMPDDEFVPIEVTTVFMGLPAALTPKDKQLVRHSPDVGAKVENP